jgi:hypothetical protein
MSPPNVGGRHWLTDASYYFSASARQRLKASGWRSIEL